MTLLRSILGQPGERLDVRGKISSSLGYYDLNCGAV